MKKVIGFLILGMVGFTGFAQYEYEPSVEHPYGLPNPKAARSVQDYQQLIGLCQCSSVSRKQDQTWAEPVEMLWKFKYIMNGMAVQDETLKADGRHSGSIRQFNEADGSWYVHYYSSTVASPQLTAWKGGMKEGQMILYSEQKAPNGMDGFFKIAFSNISDKGFDWLGAWVNKDESIVYPTWKIQCKKLQNK
ncbi:hypothetical protein [Spongiimicrobium salis]|uniref:hypothetical protein n=1 Tax=Spongiimicrobium salis TaxID=1667022 RepID=UPI00374DAD0E